MGTAFRTPVRRRPQIVPASGTNSGQMLFAGDAPARALQDREKSREGHKEPVGHADEAVATICGFPGGAEACEMKEIASGKAAAVETDFPQRSAGVVLPAVEFWRGVSLIDDQA